MFVSHGLALTLTIGMLFPVSDIVFLAMFAGGLLSNTNTLVSISEL
jgi:hypothetical protein